MGKRGIMGSISNEQDMERENDTITDTRTGLTNKFMWFEEKGGIFKFLLVIFLQERDNLTHSVAIFSKYDGSCRLQRERR